MEIIPLKSKYIREIVSWIKSESDMVQWAGLVFTWPMTQKQFKEHIKKGKKETQTLFPFVMVNDNRLIGYCELSAFHRHTNQARLTRVIISPWHRNKGMAAVMLKEVLNFGFETLDLNRIALGVFDFNEAAIKCYKKLGFSLEGTMRESAKTGNTYWNCYLMSILRKEWNC
ncbi:GNAT family N-acetyltransferase [Thermodesulfobacteriota bacterium]